MTLRGGMSSGMWEGLTVNVISSKQLISTDDEWLPVIRQRALPGCNKMVKEGSLGVRGWGFYCD